MRKTKAIIEVSDCESNGICWVMENLIHMLQSLSYYKGIELGALQVEQNEIVNRIAELAIQFLHT